MIRLTWLQFRVQAAAAAAVLAAAAVTLAVTGPRLARLCGASGPAACQASYRPLQYLGYVLLAVPGIIGIFWGAPLITRELEAGTLRLAWSQSITRGRWLAVKLAVTCLASMATAGLLSLMVTWWSSPVDTASMSRFQVAMFGQRGIAPAGYTAFAFALGVGAGVLIRRTVPAMAATLAIFTAIQFTVPNWVRPHLATPLQITAAPGAVPIFGLTTPGPGPGPVTVGVSKLPDWITSVQVIDAAGHVASNVNTAACGNESPPACLSTLHLRLLISYQPASRYWAFQWAETAIYLALALALAGYCFWSIRRRRLSP